MLMTLYYWPPSANAMRLMLSECDGFGCQYSVKFNAIKSKSMLFIAKSKGNRHQTARPNFCINGQSIEYVNAYVHLGHVISADLNDRDDIERCRSALVGQINNVISFFGKLDPVVKIRLLIFFYCYSLYGSVLWNLSNSNVERICSTWKAGLRRVWGLPRSTHRMLLPFLSCQPPLSDVIAKRFVVYVQRCLSSNFEIVKCVTRYGLWFGRMAFPMGCSV